MDEQKIYMVELDGLFPEYDDPPKVHGTSGEVLERIADEYGLEDEENEDVDIPLDGVYPSKRAFRAHQLMEDRIGKSGVYMEPDTLLEALIKEGLVRNLTEDEFESWLEDEDMDEYEEARSELDDEWTDGVWEN